MSSTPRRRTAQSALGTVFTYAVRSGYMDVNPTQGVAQVLTKGKPEDRRLPFTLDDVKTILDATKDEQAENLWIPRLALYTGARANELCGLLTRDVGLTATSFTRQSLAARARWGVAVLHRPTAQLKTLTAHWCRVIRQWHSIPISAGVSGSSSTSATSV